MIFSPALLEGAWTIQPTPVEDERGSFTRTFDAEAWRTQGLDPAVVQCSVSFNTRRGTLRGLHYQASPHGEAKVVRCTRGAIYDVIVDLRQDSSSYCRWFAVELSESNGTMLYVPVGFAHGFQTLSDATEVSYQISRAYAATHGRGVRWDDAAFGIEWPHADERVISERDRTYADYRP
ncbi:MAG: dTDP-4-dehydrorhamnose 3,5-epimerase [Gaiellaceae bacterium]